MSRKIRNDFILIGIIVLVSAVSLILFFNTDKQGAYAEITYNGNETNLVYPLDENIKVVLSNGKEIAKYEIDGEIPSEVLKSLSNYNVFEIRDGYAKMLAATCSGQDCVNHSKSNSTHMPIVCSPNKVIINIVDGKHNDVDFIS